MAHQGLNTFGALGNLAGPGNFAQHSPHMSQSVGAPPMGMPYGNHFGGFPGGGEAMYGSFAPGGASGHGAPVSMLQQQFGRPPPSSAAKGDHDDGLLGEPPSPPPPTSREVPQCVGHSYRQLLHCSGTDTWVFVGGFWQRGGFST
jgi:hypothetical protein